MRYTLTIEDHELPLVRAVLGRKLDEKPAPKPRAAKVAADAVDTGDEALDAFMNRARARGARAMTRPPLPPRRIKPPKRLTVPQFEAEERAWADLAARGDQSGFVAALVSRAALMQAVAAR